MKKNNCTSLSSFNRPLNPGKKCSGKNKLDKDSKNKVKTMFYHKK